MPTESGTLRILHVDDEPSLAEMVGTFLERDDDRFDVETATSASEGLDRLADATFDCIVSDYDMPGLDGIEFLEAVREEYPDLPFILYTGKGSEEVASDAISAGATDYLQKASGTEQYELLANRIRNAVDQYRSAHRAAELDRVRTLASDINKALVRAESRIDAETRICEIISESYPYLFAWVGEVDSETGRLIPRTSAGVDAGYLDEITVTTDDTATGQGPGGTAIRERRVAVSQNVQADSEVESWREAALERGFQAIAAVPLLYEDTLYGAMGVYSERPYAFDEDERELLAELGDDIAHAIHSFEVEEQLRTERDRRRALFENAPGPVIASELRDGTDELVITDVNEAFTDVFGYEREEIVGQDPAHSIVPEDGMERHEAFRERAIAGETIIAEVERVTAEGPRTFLLHLVPFTESNGQVAGIYAWYTDISARREREAAIENLHDTVRTIMATESDAEIAEVAVDAVRDILGLPTNAVHLYDERAGELVPVAWTDQVTELVGEPPTFGPGEGLAWSVYETGDAELYTDVSTASDRYNPETAVRSEIILPLGGHGVLLIGSTESAAFDETDVDLARTLASHVTTALDRLVQERELQEYEMLVETVGDPMYVLNAAGYIEKVNAAMLTQLDADREAVVGTHVSQFMADGDFERGTELLQEVLADPDREWDTLEFTAVTTGGNRIPAELNLAILTDDTGAFTGSVGVVRDISERNEYARKLTALHDVATALETCESAESVYEVTVNAAESILAFDIAIVDEATDDTLVPRAVSSSVSPDQYYSDKPIAAEDSLAARAYRTGDASVVADVRTNDVAPADSAFRSALTVPIGDYGVFQAAAETPGAFDETDLELAELLVSHTESALNRLTYEQDLERKNERLEEFTRVVGHDLRNPLNVAQGSLALAAEDCDSDQLTRAVDAVDRSLELIEDLLRLARSGDQVTEVGPVDLGRMLADCWQNVETADASLAIETEQTILADSSRLKQLLENLMRNAVEHGGDTVSVTVDEVADGDGFYVADDGPGIDEASREEIFDAGYSTTADGTGFGLNIVHEIVDAHDWEITVSKSEAGGVRFDISGVEVPE